MYAKLIEGNLVYPPNVYERADRTTIVGYPQRVDLLIQDGWKEVVDNECPTSGLWVSSWVEAENTITRVWTERGKTAEEIAAEEQALAEEIAAEEQALARETKINEYREAYAGATAQLCQLANIPVVRVLEMETIQTIVLPLLSGENAGMANGILTLLTNIEGKLCRLDGEDALERI